MSERKFSVEVRVTKVVDEFYEVLAESFEEAQRLVENGEGSLYEEEDWDRSDSAVTNVVCCDCDSDEDSCTCGEPDDTVNPDHDKGLGPENLDEGMWIVPDEWTSGQNDLTQGPMRVYSIGCRDSDDEYSFNWYCSDESCCDPECGPGHHDYLHHASRFKEVPDPRLTEEEQEEQAAVHRAAAAQAESAVRQQLYLNELLTV